MNDEMSGRRLGDALREHVPAHPHAPLDLADVKTTAGRIRRRRTVAGVAAAAVAAAILTPAAFLALGGDDASRPIDPAPPAPTPTLVPTPRADVTLSEDAPRGDEPDDWWHESFTERPLSHDALPEGTNRVSRLGDRWVGSSSAPNGDNPTVHLIDDQGDIVQEFEARGSFAVSDDHELAAWVTVDDALMLMDSQGETRLLATLPGGADPIDVTGGAGCVDESAVDDCRVVVNYDTREGSDVVSGDGVVTPVPDSITRVSAVFSDVAAGNEVPPAGEYEGCTRLIDLTDGTTRWRDCDIYVTSFSPDGRWVTVVDAGTDGWGPTRVGIADATTGEVFFWIDPSGNNRAIRTTAWEGSEHLVVDSYDFTAQEWRLFRVSLTGEVEQAADMVKGDDVAFPFIAPNQP